MNSARKEDKSKMGGDPPAEEEGEWPCRPRKRRRERGGRGGQGQSRFGKNGKGSGR